MPEIQVVSREHHANKRWQRYTSYSFAAGDAVAQLVVQELSKACMVFPVGFIAAEGGFAPVAVQGLAPGQNLLVAQDGQWLADYVPAVYRSYPFLLGNTKDGKQVLCVVADSGLVSDTEGELFFTDDAEPAQSVKEVFDFLTKISANRQLTLHICAVLQEHSLLQPWAVKLQTDQGEQVVEGLYRINETALNQLHADAFEALRQSGALPMVYCQLLSMQHLKKFEKLLQAQSAPPTPQAPDGELDLEFLNDSDTITFGKLY